ncbi:MAG: efflux RND transporter permease subunit [Phycisphaeraceae bacterium]
MKIARFTVARPIFTVMVTLMILIIGLVSLSRLPIDLLPDVSSPTLTVATTYENASPEEMEEIITRPVEQAVSAVPGVQEIASSSSEGVSSVRLQFAWGTDLDVAANDVRDRLERIYDELPEGVDRPQVRKFDVAQYPILILGVASNLDPIQLQKIIDDQIRYRIERIPGVAVADVFGGYEREIQVNIELERLKALGLAFDEVIARLREANINVPAGQINRGNFEVTIRTPGQFANLKELENTVIARRGRSSIYLHQVATINDTHRKITRIVRINGEPGVRLGVRKQSGTNTVEVARLVLEELAKINADMPQLRVVPVVDTSQFIERSIRNVSNSVLFGGALAILVLLFFLRNVRSTFVISTAIPISIIATFALVYFGGFTLNLMTLGGLALGVGMMVDNAIVVLENIYRHTEEGQPRREASIKGTEEVTAAIIASTVTTLVIFLPLVFVRGVAGVLFSQLALVVTFSLICSLLVALTLVPMLTSRLLKERKEAGAGKPGLFARVHAWSNRAFDLLDDAYRSLLHGIMRVRFLSLLVTAGVVAGAVMLVPLIGTEFMPASDEGEVRVTAEMEVGTRLDVVDDRVKRLETIVQKTVPEIDSWTVSIGSSTYRPSSSASGEITLALKTLSQRSRSSDEIADGLRKALGEQPGMVIRVRASQGNRLLTRLIGGDEGVQIEIRGYEFEVLDAIASRVRDAIKDVSGVTDVRVSREAGVPQQLFVIDRARAADLGLSVSQIARSLETGLSGSQAGGFRDVGDEYRLLVKLAGAEFLDIEDILDLTLTSTTGDQVSLRNVVKVQPQRGPTIIERKSQQRQAVVSANISGRDLGSVVKDVQAKLRELPLPANYEVGVAGDYEEQQEAFIELAVSLGLSILLVYMVMACLYESLIDPLIVMFSVPLAIIGVALALFLTDTTFNIQSFIGCIMLGGIVVNNAILIVDQTDQLRRHEGFTVRDALAEAGRRRLRPILMTSLTTILGLLPLALGIGEGAEAQAPLARAVIGGLLSSTFITLIVIPIVYSLFHREKRAI